MCVLRILRHIDQPPISHLVSAWVWNEAPVATHGVATDDSPPSGVHMMLTIKIARTYNGAPRSEPRILQANLPWTVAIRPQEYLLDEG